MPYGILTGEPGILTPPDDAEWLPFASNAWMQRRAAREEPMNDLIFVAVTVLFFLLSWLYVKACERM